MITQILKLFSDEADCISVVDFLRFMIDVGVCPEDLHRFETTLKKDEESKVSLHELSEKLLAEEGLFSSVVEALGAHVKKKAQATFLDLGISELSLAHSALDLEGKGYIVREDLINFAQKSQVEGSLTTQEASFLFDVLQGSHKKGSVTREDFLRSFPVTMQKREWGVKLEISGEATKTFKCPICDEIFYHATEMRSFLQHLTCHEKTITTNSVAIDARFVIGKNVGMSVVVFKLPDENVDTRSIVFLMRTTRDNVSISLRDISPKCTTVKQMVEYSFGSGEGEKHVIGSIPHISETAFFPKSESEHASVDVTVPRSDASNFKEILKGRAVHVVIDIRGGFHGKSGWTPFRNWKQVLAAESPTVVTPTSREFSRETSFCSVSEVSSTTVSPHSAFPAAASIYTPSPLELSTPAAFPNPTTPAFPNPLTPSSTTSVDNVQLKW